MRKPIYIIAALCFFIATTGFTQATQTHRIDADSSAELGAIFGSIPNPAYPGSSLFMQLSTDRVNPDDCVGGNCGVQGRLFILQANGGAPFVFGSQDLSPNEFAFGRTAQTARLRANTAIGEVDLRWTATTKTGPITTHETTREGDVVTQTVYSQDRGNEGVVSGTIGGLPFYQEGVFIAADVEVDIMIEMP